MRVSNRREASAELPTVLAIGQGEGDGAIGIDSHGESEGAVDGTIGPRESIALFNSNSITPVALETASLTV